MSWTTITRSTLSLDDINALANNSIGAIRIPGFISEDRCKSAVTKIMAHGINYYENITPKVGRIGITQTEHTRIEDGQRLYFEKATQAEKTRRELFSDGGDIVDEVIEMVRKGSKGPVDVAKNSNGQSYFAGVVRVVNRAVIHTDWAKRDASSWSNAAIRAQLAWNVYLQVESVGGTLVVYQKPWEEKDEIYKRKDGGYGYVPEVVTDCAVVKVTPELGDLVFFNSLNYHEVTEMTGNLERISISSFLGIRESDNELIFWS